MTDWYEKRNELHAGQIFRTRDGSIVLLDQHVPGDATKWYVADRSDGVWVYWHSTIEPGDLVEKLDSPLTTSGPGDCPNQPGPRRTAPEEEGRTP